MVAVAGKRRPPSKYGAYWRMRGSRKWKRRDTDIQGSKDSIVRLYQTWLLQASPGIERSIRRISRKKV
jgi:hypothetical protein